MTRLAIIRYPSPIQWLVVKLERAIATLSPATSIDLPPISTSLQQFGTLASPVLLKLGAEWRRTLGAQRSPQEIGATLIEQLSNQIVPNDWLRPEFTLQPSGWLYIHFSGAQLSTWLQTLLFAKPELHWIDLPPEELSEPIALGISEDPILFQLQYAHARCCSLLRLAQQAQIIDLAETDTGLRLASTDIPWQTPEGALRLQNQSERKLLLALMEFPRSVTTHRKHPPNIATNCTDTIIDWPIAAQDLQTQAQFWGDLFLNFYSESRILGDVQTQTPELAQLRTVLIYITRMVLAFFLEQLRRIEAPMIL